jgi:hypothetical protein
MKVLSSRFSMRFRGVGVVVLAIRQGGSPLDGLEADGRFCSQAGRARRLSRIELPASDVAHHILLCAFVDWPVPSGWDRL